MYNAYILMTKRSYEIANNLLIYIGWNKLTLQIICHEMGDGTSRQATVHR